MGSNEDIGYRIMSVGNPYQGDYKRVLCVCSAGLLRSPTAALVLSSPPYNYNTRCAGLNEDVALISVNETLLCWADEIVCMDTIQKLKLIEMLGNCRVDEIEVRCLNIPDKYTYRDPCLIELIKDRYSYWMGDIK